VVRVERVLLANPHAKAIEVQDSQFVLHSRVSEFHRCYVELRMPLSLVAVAAFLAVCTLELQSHMVCGRCSQLIALGLRVTVALEGLPRNGCW
jgi:hypothetical protein